jgi:hypothetical protein
MNDIAIHVMLISFAGVVVAGSIAAILFLYLLIMDMIDKHWR